MHWLNVRYSPGFQYDLTSWVLSIAADGSVVQDADVCLFSPHERRKDTYRSRLGASQMSDLKRRLSALVFSEIAAAANELVIDDAEQVTITYLHDTETLSFTAPLEWWAHQQSRGDVQSPAILDAIDLWRQILPLSQYKGRPAGA